MFGKVYAQIFDGTLHGHLEATAVFMALIALADSDGAVDLTLTVLTRRTGWPESFVERGIRELEAVDPCSRSPDEEGRRIVRLRDNTDWGWRIVNYLKYRDIRDDSSRRAYMREYMRSRRSKQPVNNGKQPLALLAHAEEEADIGGEQAKKTPRPRGSTFPGDFALSPDIREKAVAKFTDCDPDAMFEAFRAHHVAKGSVMRSWPAAWTTWLAKAEQFGYPKAKAGGRTWQ